MTGRRPQPTSRREVGHSDGMGPGQSTAGSLSSWNSAREPELLEHGAQRRRRSHIVSRGETNMKRLLLILVSASVAIVTSSAQSPAAKPIPRTPDGKPDFTGNWTNATITPFERTANRPHPHGRHRARAEISTRQAPATRETGDADGAATQAASPAAPAVSAEVAQFERRWQAGFGDVGGYNSFWVDTGERVLRLDGLPRDSILIDPPDGRVPPVTPEAQARAQAAAASPSKAGGEFDHPELRPLAERCMMSFGSNAGPPMLPNY